MRDSRPSRLLWMRGRARSWRRERFGRPAQRPHRRRRTRASCADIDVEIQRPPRPSRGGPGLGAGRRHACGSKPRKIRASTCTRTRARTSRWCSARRLRKPGSCRDRAVALGRADRRSGPSRGEWAGFLLVDRASRGLSRDLGVQRAHRPQRAPGRVTARTENGPISAHRSTGEVDLEAENGPISFFGVSGRSKLRTQNGPIDVTLGGRSWEGDGLDARAVNGPVSLSIPSGYGSATVVESAGRSPVQCRGEGCGTARKTWDDDSSRRLEVGEGPVLVRVATRNGPVTVRTGTAADEDEE